MLMEQPYGLILEEISEKIPYLCKIQKFDFAVLF